MHRLIRHLHKRRAGIRVRIDRHRLDTHAARRLDNPASNFATVGDEDFFEHLDTPKFVAVHKNAGMKHQELRNPYFRSSNQ
jgi:hypothetical protein